MHSEMHGITLLLLVFFVTDLHAIKADAKHPAIAEQPLVLIATPPQNQADPSLRKPEVSPATSSPAKPQEVASSKPAPANDGDSAAPLTNLPAAKRLAISVGAGLFTLVLALWIGARRD